MTDGCGNCITGAPQRPCTPCEPNPLTPESVTSQLANLTLELFGEVTKTFEGGRVVWTVPCDAASYAMPGIPRQQGEGLLCYLLRCFASGIVRTVTAPANLTDFSMFPGAVAPDAGFYQAADNTKLYTIKGGDTTWYSQTRQIP